MHQVWDLSTASRRKRPKTVHNDTKFLRLDTHENFIYTIRSACRSMNSRSPFRAFSLWSYLLHFTCFVKSGLRFEISVVLQLHETEELNGVTALKDFWGLERTSSLQPLFKIFLFLLLSFNASNQWLPLQFKELFQMLSILTRFCTI